MALLDDVIDASGGIGRWSKLTKFTLHLSVGGDLLSRAGRTGYFKEVIAEGLTQVPAVRFTGIAGGEKCGSFQADTITLESLDGQPLRTWQNLRTTFPELTVHALADELQLIFFCGIAVWNYLTMPFLLAHPDVVVRELSPWRESTDLRRRLHVRFPSHLTTSASEQVLYFDEHALQRRADHDLLGMKVAQYSWAHQTFSGVVIPTLRRSQILLPDGTVVAKPIMIDVEIFDASFE